MDSDDEEDEDDEEACTELTKNDVTDLLDCFHVEGDEDDDEYE
jgi:hypothetical protein